MQKQIILRDRVRRVPRSFSWVDHRLVRQNHLMKASAPAWGLYLVLVTVGDEQGLSYYAWWRKRSRMAPAVGTSWRSLPQSSRGRLLVMMVERFS